MGRERTDFLIGVLENLPTILFLGIWKTGLGLEAAGWSACLSAAAVLMLFHRLRRPFDPIVLGININFLLTTPVIVGLFAAGQVDLARAGVHFAASGAVATVFVTGAVVTLLSPRGFLGSDRLPRAVQRRYSTVLLLLAAAAVPWSFAHAGQHWMSIVLPLIVLFAARRFILAHLADRHQGGGETALAATVLPNGAADPG